MSLLEEKVPEKTVKHASGVTTAISFASLLLAAIVGAVSLKVVPPAAFWVSAIGFAVVATVFIAPYIKSAFARLVSWQVRRRVRRQYRGQILALCRSLLPLAQQSCVVSAGSIINPAINQKLIEPTNANAHFIALVILHDRMSDLLRFESSATDHEVMRLVHGWLQSYQRVCDGIYYSIKGSPQFVELHQGQWESLGRNWNEIRQRATALCSEYSRLAYGIVAAAPQNSLPDYLSPMPEFVK